MRKEIKELPYWSVFPHMIVKRKDGFFVHGMDNNIVTVIKPKNKEIEKDLIWLLETKKFDLKEYQEKGSYWV